MRPTTHRHGIPLSLTLFCASFVIPRAFSAEADATAVTIYSSAAPGAVSAEFYRPIPGSGVSNGLGVPGYAVVRQDRTVRLDNGRSTLKFADVAALIDPTTVTFASLTDPKTRVLEQNFQFDLVSTEKLLLKFVDRTISVERSSGDRLTTSSGTLLSSGDGLVLKGSDGSIQAIKNFDAVRFPDLPGGLNTRPTLVWDIQSAKSGDQRARVSYQTGGVTWWTDYNLIFSEGKDANSGLLDLSAWVSIVNLSGATYTDAKLKLVAGDVNRAAVPPQINEVSVTSARAMYKEADTGFQQKAFFEFHLYTLGRPTTLPNNSTKQIELFDQAHQIPAKQILLYDGAGFAASLSYPQAVVDRNYGIGSNKKVDVYLEFRNDKQMGLGLPMPAGRIRVSKLDSGDKSLEFIGEDIIDHTPKDENVRVKLGSAFDVVGERRQVDFSVDSKARWLEEEFEIKLRNHKELPVDVLVREPLYRAANWKVVSNSQEFHKDDAHSLSFVVKVPKDAESIVRYRVRYTW